MIDTEQEARHPAHGNVQISRITGQRSLHGCPIDALSYMRVKVALDKSYVSEGFRWSSGGTSATEVIVEFDLSETQFAHMITTMNHGEGTPCTLRRYTPGTSEDMPEPEPRLSQTDLLREQFVKHWQDRKREVRELLENLDTMMTDARVPKKHQTPFRNLMTRLSHSVESNAEFYCREFETFVDKTVQEAKAEVAAFASNVTQAAGIEALKGGTTLHLTKEESCAED